MIRKISILFTLIICIFTLSSCANSNTIDTNYEEAYFNLEEQYYELEDEWFEAYSSCDEFWFLTSDLLKLHTNEVENAIDLINVTAEQGYITDIDEYIEACEILTEYYNSVYDIALDADAVPLP